MTDLVRARPQDAPGCRCRRSDHPLRRLALSGWWFVRNLMLHGDLTGGSALGRAICEIAPMPVDSVGAWAARSSEITS